MGPLHDPVTRYGINYAGTQVTQWDFQSKGKSGWTGTSSFVLEVPLCNLRPSKIHSVPSDRIVPRANSSDILLSIRICFLLPGKQDWNRLRALAIRYASVIFRDIQENLENNIKSSESVPFFKAKLKSL